MRAFIMPFTLAALLAASGCKEETHTCTDLACRANDYRLVRDWTPGDYTLELSYTHGGDVAFECTLRIEAEDDDAGGVGHPQGDCDQIEGEPRSVALHVLGGAVTLSLYDDPETFQLELSRDGESLARDSVTPEYEMQYPDGPSCGACRAATLTIAVE